MWQSFKKLFPGALRSFVKRTIKRKGIRTSSNNRHGVFFVTLPKSGTIFTWNNLLQLTQTSFPWYMEDKKFMEEYSTGRDDVYPGTWGTGDFSSQKILNPALMQKYIQQGHTFGAHMPGTFHNIEKLMQAGVGKITVLIRDPRDATVSWTYHVAKSMQSHMIASQKFYHMPPYYSELSHPEQIAFQVRTFLPLCLNWIESWFSYYAAQDSRLRIQLVYFEEMQASPQSYFRKILAFQGCDPALADKFVAPTDGKWHFRKGKSGEWQNEFSEQDKQLSELLFADRLKVCINSAIDKHPMSLAADSAEQQGDWRRAFQSRVKVLHDLPLTQSLENRLLNASQRINSEVHAVTQQLLMSSMKDTTCFDPTLGPALETIAMSNERRLAA